MSTEIAGLYTTLTAADEEFVAACKRDETALEKVATTSEATNAKMKAGAGERAAAEEAAAGKTLASQSAMGRGWAGLTKAIGEHGSKAEQVWTKVTHIGQMSGLALLGIGVASVKMASDFQSSMELVHTQAGASQEEVKALGAQVLALAPTVGIGPEKLADGLYHIESAGFRGQQAMEILAASAKDAAIGMSDMESTSQALIGVMAAGFTDVKNAADAAAFLNTTVGIGDMRMEKLAAAISTGVLPSFKAAGLGMTDFSAALATLTDNVTPADEAATRLRMTVALLAAPSDKAMGALESIGLGAEEANNALANRSSLEKYGISISALAEDLHKPNGLLAATMDLKTHLEAAGLTATEQAAVLEHAFGGGRTSGAIMTLLEESDRLQSKYEAIGDSSTRAANMQESWAKTQENFKQQLHDVGAQMQVIGIQIGNMLLPPLTKLFGFLASHSGLMKVFFGIIVAGMIAFTAAVVANTIAMLANPVTWIVLAIVAAVALLAIGIYELVKHWGTVWGFIKRIALDVWHWLVDAWHWLLEQFHKGADGFHHYVIEPIVHAWHNLVDSYHIVLNLLQKGAQWLHDHVIMPIVHFFDAFFVRPIKMYLHMVSVAWQFAWGFLSVIIADFKKVWQADWAVISGIIQWAWNNVIKPVIDFIIKYGIEPVKEGIHLLGVAWSAAWDWICTRVDDAWAGLKIVWGFVDEYGIQPLKEGIYLLAQGFSDAWDWICRQVDNAWGILKTIWGYIDRDGIEPIKSAISTLASDWDQIWNAIASTLENIWDSYIEPILGRISGAISSVKSGISDVMNAPSQAGSALAHFLGFDQGGWVPGPPGSPMLAVVHGGEFVVSRDMLAGRGATPIKAGSPAGVVGTGTPGRSVVESHVHVYLDGEEIQRSTMRSAGRHKVRNGSNGFG